MGIEGSRDRGIEGPRDPRDRRRLGTFSSIGALGGLILAFTVAPHLREKRIPIERDKAKAVVSKSNGTPLIVRWRGGSAGRSGSDSGCRHHFGNGA
jgi:hypothetical protein